MNKIELITVVNNYWILKPVKEGSHIFFIRKEVEQLKNTQFKSYSWFTGCKNTFGLISGVGGDLSEETQIELEKEFQEAIN